MVSSWPIRPVIFVTAAPGARDAEAGRRPLVCDACGQAFALAEVVRVLRSVKLSDGDDALEKAVVHQSCVGARDSVGWRAAEP